MATVTVWEPATAPILPELPGDACADICVVGAGIAGVAIAAELSRRGHDVVVLQDAPAAGLGGETERSTAQLVTALDRGYRSLVAVHGRDLAKLAAASHRAAIDRAQALVEERSIACDFSRLDGVLFSDDAGALEQEHEAARAAGVLVERVTAPLACRVGGALRFPEQAQLDPVRFTNGLAAAAGAAGTRMFGRARVVRLEHGTGHVVHTHDGGRVVCDHVVVATNAPVGGFLSLDARQAAYRSYVVGLEVGRDAIQQALYWDTEEPFHYVRTCRDRDGAGDLLLVGGEDHKTGRGADRPAECWERLEAWTRRSFPQAGAVRHRWSGQIMETIDGLAFIGAVGSGVHVVTGDCGNGITHALIAGALVPDLIEGKPNPWEPVYAPNRIRLHAVGTLLRETADVVAQMGRWVLPSEVPGEDAIPRESGAVLRRGLGKVAVYRDGDGVIHERSAACPHLGCVVAWNPAEHTWDCPCHGSRFDPLGDVVHGPASQGLAPVEPEGSDPERELPRPS